MIKTQNPAAKKWARGKQQLALAATEKKIGKAGHVYIFDLRIKCYHKIGCTSNIQRRLKDLSASNPGVRCIWSAWVKDMHAVEKILHEHFEKYRIEREVFELTRDDVFEANEIVNKIKEEYAPY